MTLDHNLQETLFWALVFWVALMGHLGFMGCLADWLERNVKWGKTERRQFGRFMDKRRPNAKQEY